MTKDKQQHTRYHQLSKRVYLLLVSSQASLEVYVDRDRRVPDWGVPVRRAYRILSVIERSLPRVQVVQQGDEAVEAESKHPERAGGISSSSSE
jgi:hypothetical protein